MLATDLAAALDPVLLARAAGIDPDPWQARVLRSAAPRLLLNCSRQSGKSTIVSILATHQALYQPNSLVLLLSPSLRQSGELFKKCSLAYRQLGRPVSAESETTLTLTLENGSRIVSLPGSEGTVRGFSGVSLLCVDEASRVLDDLYFAVRPMLAVSGGRLVTMSTPFGRRGFFHAEWTEGSGWERYEVPASQCPRIPAAFLEEERRALPPWVFAQEYGCVFGETVNQLFPFDLVAGAVAHGEQPLFGGGGHVR